MSVSAQVISGNFGNDVFCQFFQLTDMFLLIQQLGCAASDPVFGMFLAEIHFVWLLHHFVFDRVCYLCWLLLLVEINRMRVEV